MGNLPPKPHRKSSSTPQSNQPSPAQPNIPPFAMQFRALLAVASLVSLVAASPLASPAGSNLVLPRAGGRCFGIADSGMLRYDVVVDSPQDGGLCGGFWDNLNGHSACNGASRRECVVRGSAKHINFWVPIWCQPGDVNWIIQQATPEHFNLGCEISEYLFTARIAKTRGVRWLMNSFFSPWSMNGLRRR